MSHFEKYLVESYNVSDVSVKKIDFAMMTGFDFYLRSTLKCNNNTTIKYVKSVGKIINICLDNGWIEKDPLSNYKAKLKVVDREFLTELEIESMLNKQFVIPRLELVRDIFVFSCFTG